MLHQAVLGHTVIFTDSENINAKGWTPLFEACRTGNILAVKFLLENHDNPNATNQHGETALHLICSRKSATTLQIIQLLLKHNADINAVNNIGWSPLFVACISDNIAAVKSLLENHANPNLTDQDGETPLHRLCLSKFEKKLTIMQLLLKHNADINAVNNIGWSSLFVACISENIAAVESLLENHANPNVRDREGQTVLHFICSSESETTLQIIQLLLKHNADIEAVDAKGWTPLSDACYNGNDKTVKFLLEKHANPNVRDREGQTALHSICSSKSNSTRQIIQLLLKHNADIEAVDAKGWTPLFEACRTGNIEAAKVLLENHANPNASNQRGYTVLHLFCLRKFETTPQVMQFLLKQNADIEAVDENGRTPLFVACIRGNDKAVKCLLRYGANVNISDKKNQSLLQCAVDKMLSTSSVNSNIHTIIQMLVSHIIKLKTARHNVSVCEFITTNGVKYSAIDGLKSNTVLNDSEDTLKCEEEIERMKMESVGINNMFLYDLLTHHIHLLGILMENKKIQEILKPSIYDEKFPLYIGIIRFRLRDAQIRYRQYKLKKSAREYFSSNINQELPHECIDKVLDYLTIVDLKTFIRTFEPPRESTTFKRILRYLLDFVQFK
ncbi:ankyrin-1-like [Chelonus insularis]|uniref:ankyrin-1-like n=1 Tax=Chelonus insularis TaxID=460826 RepID=UPI0015887B07|nr:ankyrin-1-like [Chelonus insularis]